MSTTRLAVPGLAASILVLLATPVIAGPTLVELFTSEGCNSCPPADAYLHDLATANGGGGGAGQNIFITWHVDYWDHLGWKDPYGLPIATKRQRDYASAMKERDSGRPGVYTPQMIVAGRRAFVGSDRRTGRIALGSAQRGTARPLDIAVAGRADQLTITTELPNLPADVSIMAVLVEDGLTSVVTAGENTGRTLTHDRVARAAAVGEVTDDTAAVHLTVPDGVVRANASVVLFAQAADMGEILAVGTTPLVREPADQERYQTLAIGKQQIRYALILPDGFDPAKTYPAILALPPGAQNEAMVEAGLGRYWERTARERGWIVVSPINPPFAKRFQARTDPLALLLDDISKRFNIEGDRFHLTGVSNGGRAAFLAALEDPERFASLTVLPGMLAENTPAGRITGLREMPISMYVGGNDADWVREAERSVDELKKHGVAATLTVLDGEGHVVALFPTTIFDLLDSVRP